MPGRQKAGTTRVGLTLPDDLIARAEEEAARLRASTGLAVTVPDVLKATLERHLPPIGEPAPAKKAAKKR